MEGSSDVQYSTLGVESKDSEIHRRFPKTIIVTVVAITVLIVVVVGVAVLLGVIENQRSSSATSQCLSQECVQLSSSVLAAMDQTIDPCNDFYQFSCGNWAKNTAIPISECILRCAHDVIARAYHAL